MRSTRIRLWAAISACFVLFFSSCSPRIGWGVVVWTVPEGPIVAGSVVPVYVRSNIGKVYIIGKPDNARSKLEVPQWRVELFGTRGKARARVKAFGDYLHMYMQASRDGVPIREKPTNAAKRVFRLRLGQSVKILEKVEGEVVTTGSQALPGDWYRVLADDGTTGYVFSFAMKIYDETTGGSTGSGDDSRQADRIDWLFSRSWRPSYYQEMIDSGAIDLDRFSLRYGLFADAVNRQVRIELPGVSRTFAYSAISDSKGVIAFDGTPLTIRFESDTILTAQWPDTGTFVTLVDDVRETIRKEELRRQDLLTAFISRAAAAARLPATRNSISFEGSNAGTLTLKASGRFTWVRSSDMPADFLPGGAGDSGELRFRLPQDVSGAGDWDGVLSLDFPDADSPWVDYLYKFAPDGLVLARGIVDPASGRVASADQSIGLITLTTIKE